MRSFIQLFDLVSGNYVADFASEVEAWSALRQWAAEDGPESLRGLSLMLVRNGDPILIAMEDDLVSRAIGDDRQSNSNAERGVRRSRRVAS